MAKLRHFCVIDLSFLLFASTIFLCTHRLRSGKLIVEFSFNSLCFALTWRHPLGILLFHLYLSKLQTGWHRVETMAGQFFKIMFRILPLNRFADYSRYMCTMWSSSPASIKKNINPTFCEQQHILSILPMAEIVAFYNDSFFKFSDANAFPLSTCMQRKQNL